MNPYFEQTILHADPVQLIGMIYQRALASVREAREHLADKRILERSTAIGRAYRALAELNTALRPETAPEIAARLQGLYHYMMQRLLDANMQQADAPLEEVLSLLSTLAEAWAGVATEASRAEQATVTSETSRLPAGRWHEAVPADCNATGFAICA
jgi:flagellar secretion chaperone FliS